MPDSNSSTSATPTSASQGTSYWQKSLQITLLLLAVWAFLSLGCGVVLRKFLDSTMPSVGGAPFGFWMAQQGAIVGFVILLIVYMLFMNRLDAKHGYSDDQQQGGAS